MRCVWDLKCILMQCIHLLITAIYALISLTTQQRDKNLPDITVDWIRLDWLASDTIRCDLTLSFLFPSN